MCLKGFFNNFWFPFEQAFAQRLAAEVKAYGYNVELVDMKTYDPEENLAEEVSLSWIIFFLFP